MAVVGRNTRAVRRWWRRQSAPVTGTIGATTSGGGQALDWLEDNEFDTTADSVDQGELEAAIAKAFPQSAKPAKVGRPPAVDWDLVNEEAIRLMDYHGEFGPDSPEWNAQAKGRGRAGDDARRPGADDARGIPSIHRQVKEERS